MIYPEQLKIDTGRSVGGDFIRVTHLPTNITITQNPPLINNHDFYKNKLISEIEKVLVDRGPTEYICIKNNESPN